MPIAFSRTLHPIDFSVLSGHEFERLVFATLLRMRAWHTLNWHGQTGGDGGRDIIGVCDDQYGHASTVIVACANWQKFTLGKAKSDIDNLIDNLTEKLDAAPNEIIIVAGSSVSAETKDKIDEHARTKGIHVTQTWSGAELEERLRFHAASVLERFVLGTELPDEEQSLKDFVHKLDPATAAEAGEMLEMLFRRPAFETPIQQESSLPAFRQAITDTIGALNTGIWRDRHGAVISRVPSIAAFSDKLVVDNLKKCVASLIKLRITFDDGMRTKGVRPCQCDVPDCPRFMVDDKYRVLLEADRDNVMNYAKRALAALRASQV